MSEPVTNAEIEDVLTSIRRLVSENRRDAPAREPAAAAPVAVPEPPAPSALVLTPALRIGEEDEADAGDMAQDDGQQDEAFEASSEDDVDFVEESSEFDPSEWDVPESDAADDDALFAEDETPSDPWEDDLAEDVAEDAHESGLEELSAPVEVLAAHAFDEEDDAPDEATVAEAEAHVEPQDEAKSDEDEAPFDFAQVREARIVHWRDADSPDDVEEPDAPGDSDYAGTDTAAPGWSHIDAAGSEAALDDLEEALNADFAEELTAEVERTAMPELADAVDEVPEIDEEILREMVADIVRRELQGALGERITRNVRKLVRREIHRALAAHDLD